RRRAVGCSRPDGCKRGSGPGSARAARHPGDVHGCTAGGTVSGPVTGHNERMNVNWRAAARGWPRAAVAFARSTQPRSAVSRRAVAADVVLAAGFLVVSLIEVARLGQPGSVSAGLPEGSGHGVLRPAKDLLQPGAGLGVAGVLAAVVTSVPLAARRLLPLTTFWVVLGATALTSHHTTLATFAALGFAASNAVVRSRFRGPALLSLPLAAAAIMAVFPNTAPPLPARATPLILFIPILVVGNVVHVWRRRAGDSQDRLRRHQL